MAVVVLSDGECVARKRHICDECLNDISIGEKYHNQCNIFEGNFGVWKSHLICREVAIYLNRESMEGEWSPIHDHCSADIEEARKHIAKKTNKPNSKE